MKIKFLDYLKNNRIYLDGALGTEFIARGYSEQIPELLSLTAPEVVSEIHSAYAKAGSTVITANTFGANPLKLKGSGYTLDEVVCASLTLAKKCAKGKFTAYSCGPTGELLKPLGSLDFEDAYNLFKEQAVLAEKYGADLAVLETFSDLSELKAAVLAFKENSNLPVACSMSFDERGRTFTGTGIGAFALTVQGLGVDLIGMNCGLGPELMAKNTKELIKYAHTPVFVQPNAGLPVYKNGVAFYGADAEKFSAEMKKTAELGVSVLGGCCGTNKEYINKTIAATKDIPFKFFNNKIDAVCSASSVVEFNSGSLNKEKPVRQVALPVKIGEKVNPTGKPALKKALAEKDFDFVVSMCAQQIGQGAQLLDLNAGMPGIDEAAVLTEIVKAVQAAVTVPLQIDSADKNAVESALRVVTGVPVINSLNGKKTSMESIFPLMKKYGAYAVALCLDETGVPETVKGRIEIAKKIIAAAKEYGIEKNKLLFDALTLAVSVYGRNPSITLCTAAKLKDELKVKTVLGLSNVSFGLPFREVINAEFYRQAADQGVTALIIDPQLTPAHDIFAQNALSGKDENCKRYIEKYSSVAQTASASAGQKLFDIVSGGLKKEAVEAVRASVTENNYLEVIEKDITASLNDLGKKYEKGEAFLPQLIAASEAAKAALDEIKLRFMKESNTVKATIVLATVKGDVHDIGKNIVKALLGNYGYKIVDLGKDVSAETVVKAAKDNNADAVGLSALMTTTLSSMAETVKEVKKFNKDILVVVGGAVVTKDFAESIGADLYCRNAQEAVKKLEERFKK